MSITAVDFQNLIVATLSDADPTLQSELQSKVSFFWRLHARQPYLELRYWYTRRDMIRAAQGCVTRQVDYLRRTQNANRTSVSTSRQDSTMSGEGSDDSESVANRSSSSQYDDETNSTGTANSSATREATQGANSESNFEDTGSGSSYASRHMHSETATTERGEVQTVEDDDYAVVRDRLATGSRSGSTTVTTNPAGVAVNVGIFTEDIEIIVGTPWGTLTVPIPLPFQIEKETNTSGSIVSHDVVDHDSITGTLGSDMMREQISDINVLVQPKRELHMTMSDAPVRAHSSHSEFTANVTQSESGSSSSEMTASALSSSNYSMVGEGSGTATMSGSSESSGNGSSLRTAHGDGEEHRSTQAASQMDSRMERLHQWFLHLQTLWEQADETIKWLESQRLALTPYVIAQITIQYPEGVNTAIANALIVSTPTGRRV